MWSGRGQRASDPLRQQLNDMYSWNVLWTFPLRVPTCLWPLQVKGFPQPGSGRYPPDRNRALGAALFIKARFVAIPRPWQQSGYMA